MSFGRDASLGIAAILLIPLGIILLMAGGMALGYVGGWLYDTILGTNALPIWLLGGLVGASSSIQIDNDLKNSLRGEPVLGFLVVLGLPWVLAIIAWLVSFIAIWFFDGTAEQLIYMLGYEGSFTSFAFWGSLISGYIRLPFRV